MAILSILLFAILTAIGVLHFYWSFGGLWPGKDEKSLAQAVIGTHAISQMPPPLATAAVALAILCAGLFPLMWTALIPYNLPQGLVWIGMWVLAIVFTARGVVAYTPLFRKSNCEQPFATMDVRIYSPLSIAIGIGFLGLIYLAGV